MSDTYNDLAGTVYPNSIDSFENKMDISSLTAPYVAQYKNLLASGDISGAQTLLSTYPALRQSAITAADFNKLQDAIIAIQRFYKRDQQQIIFSKTEPSGENTQFIGDVWVKILDDGAELYELTEDGYVLRITNIDIDEFNKLQESIETVAEQAMPKTGGTFTGQVKFQQSKWLAGNTPTTDTARYIHFVDQNDTTVSKIGTVYQSNGKNYTQILHYDMDRLNNEEMIARLRVGFDENGQPYAQLYYGDTNNWGEDLEPKMTLAPVASLRNIEVRTSNKNSSGVEQRNGALQSTGKIVMIRK